MKLSIVILNWNGRAHLERFLPLVVERSEGAHIVVADNGSTDDSLAWLARYFPAVQRVVLDRNYGFAEGYNRALEDLQADLLVLLNSDVEPASGWLTPLLEAFGRDSNLVALSPKIRAVTQPDYFEYAGAAGGFIDLLGYPFCRGRILSTLEQDQGQYDGAREVFWASGACMMVRLEYFKALGGFDPDFFAHMEEIDFCWRARTAGYNIGIEPRSMVYHLGGGTLPNNSPRKLYLNYRNNLAMLYKNLSSIGLLPILLVRVVLDGLSALFFLVQGKFSFFRAVYHAHLDFYKMLPSLRRKRRQLRKNRLVNHPYGIYRGSIVLRYMLGGHKFGKLM